MTDITHPTAKSGASHAPGATTAGQAGFRPRWPWFGGDLQTLRNTVLGPVAAPQAVATRLSIPLPDGDVLTAALDRPARDGGAALAILIHGLTGCEDSHHVRATSAALLAAGIPVIRLNLRGAGPSRATCAGMYHAGRSADLASVLAALDDVLAAAQSTDLAGRARVAVGYSLGANMLLKHLGERGRAAGLAAAVSVSAPIDLEACCRRMLEPRNMIYQRYLLRRMKREALAGPAPLPDGPRRAIQEARTVRDFDDGFVAPVNGFRNAADYYARCSARRFLKKIRVPTLVLHADDDPWIPAEAYRAHDWRACEAVTPLLTRGGGHVGFHGRGHRLPWHDRAALAFVDRVLHEAPAQKV